jgi:membrane-associated protease RseP (regulator of RpoE activity)
MQSNDQNSTIKKLFYILAGLSGISLIILIHEAGHFLFAKFFNVPSPTFSIGFGPTLYAFPMGETIFKISLLPFGGYVEMDPEILAQQNYIPKMLIFFGGIIFNFIFAYVILLYYTIRNKLSSGSISSSETMKQTFSAIFTQQNGGSSTMGPIGIIRTIGQSIAINWQLYWFALAIISFNIGLMNMIPLPFFDGGKALLCTIEALLGYTIPVHIEWIISAASIAFFAILIIQVTVNDVKRLIKKG